MKDKIFYTLEHTLSGVKTAWTLVEYLNNVCEDSSAIPGTENEIYTPKSCKSYLNGFSVCVSTLVLS